jgi:hypothetical protein
MCSTARLNLRSHVTMRCVALSCTANTDSSREGTPLGRDDVVQRGRFIIRPLSPEVQQDALEVGGRNSKILVHTSAVESVLLQNQQVTASHMHNFY